MKDAGRADLVIQRSDPDADFGDDVGLSIFEAKSEKPAKRTIRNKAGALNSIAEEAKTALFEQFGHEILQRHGTLVRPVRLGAPMEDGAARFAAGSTLLIPVNESWLLKRLAAATWVRGTRQADGTPKISPADRSQKCIRIIFNDQGDWPFHKVRAIVTTPTFDVARGKPIARS